MYEVAKEQNVGLIDYRGIAPERSDTVHPTPAGYLAMSYVTRNVIRAII